MEEILGGEGTEAEREVTRVFAAQIPAREHFQRRVVAVMKEGIDAYANAHPNRMLDQRHKDGTLCSWAGMSKVFEMLGEYIISYKPDVDYEEIHLAESPRVHNGRKD